MCILANVNILLKNLGLRLANRSTDMFLLYNETYYRFRLGLKPQSFYGKSPNQKIFYFSL